MITHLDYTWLCLTEANSDFIKLGVRSRQNNVNIYKLHLKLLYMDKILDFQVCSVNILLTFLSNDAHGKLKIGFSLAFFFFEGSASCPIWCFRKVQFEKLCYQHRTLISQCSAANCDSVNDIHIFHKLTHFLPGVFMKWLWHALVKQESSTVAPVSPCPVSKVKVKVKTVYCHMHSWKRVSL